MIIAVTPLKCATEWSSSCFSLLKVGIFYRSHSPLCFLLRGPLSPSLTLLKAFRASSSSFRNMALVFFCFIFSPSKPTRWLLLLFPEPFPSGHNNDFNDSNVTCSYRKRFNMVSFSGGCHLKLGARPSTDLYPPTSVFRSVSPPQSSLTFTANFTSISGPAQHSVFSSCTPFQKACPQL